MAGPVATGDPLAGKSLFGFQILDRLGSGGMGVVYRALDRRLGRTVALKFLSSGHTTSRDARERFLIEARAASALDHPNIGTIHAIEEGPEGELCIVMAYYEGETLAARIARGPLGHLEALDIAAQVANGLAEAHARGIIHRDVKPSNVMLTRSGAKVLDFGLAKIPDSGHSLTETGAVLGTAAYMSPEQALGRETDCRSDIWSLGAVLYEMLAGRPPFEGANQYIVLHGVVYETPKELRTGRREVERIVFRALEKEPAGRYASMQEFAAELRQAASSISERAGGDTETMAPAQAVPEERAGIRKWKRKAVAGAVVFLLVAALALLGRNYAPRVVEFAREAFPAPQHTTVAILPFTGAGDAETSALAAGLTERLSQRIAPLERFNDALFIVPAGDIVSRRIDTPQQAAKLLGATLTISGVLSRRPEGGLRLDLQVFDSLRPNPFETAIEDGEGDAGALEDRVAGEICQLLDIQATPQVMKELQRRGAAGAKVYQAYLQGTGYLQRWDKPENLENALRAFGQAIRADPGFAPAYVGLAEASRTRFKIGKDPTDLQHSLNYSQQVIRLDPNLADGHAVLGRIYQDTGQRDLAVIEFQRVLELEPHNAAALIGMGRAYEDLGRIAEAEESLRKAVDLHPYDWSSLNSLASFYFRQSRYDDAEAQLRRALRFTPDNPAVYSNLGVVLTRQHKFSEAIRIFERSLELGPNYEAYVNLGNIHYVQHHFRAAAAAYDRALQLNSRNPQVWGNKAQALRHSRAPAAAVEEAFRQAIRLAEDSLLANPRQPRILSLLAVYYACVGERVKGLERARQALTISKAGPSVLIDVAVAYQILGLQEEAVRWAQKALDEGFPLEEFRNDLDLQSLLRSGALRAPR